MAEENNNPERLGTGYSFDKEELRESMGWLIKLRWIGILGVLVGTHVIREIPFLSFSLIPVYIILGFAALYNLYFRRELKFPAADLKKLAVLQIFLDQITLALAVYFSGGCDSPFYLFFHLSYSDKRHNTSVEIYLCIRRAGNFFPCPCYGA